MKFYFVLIILILSSSPLVSKAQETTQPGTLPKPMQNKLDTILAQAYFCAVSNNSQEKKEERRFSNEFVRRVGYSYAASLTVSAGPSAGLGAFSMATGFIFGKKSHLLFLGKNIPLSTIGVVLTGSAIASSNLPHKSKVESFLEKQTTTKYMLNTDQTDSFANEVSSTYASIFLLDESKKSTLKAAIKREILAANNEQRDFNLLNALSSAKFKNEPVFSQEQIEVLEKFGEEVQKVPTETPEKPTDLLNLAKEELGNREGCAGGLQLKIDKIKKELADYYAIQESLKVIAPAKIDQKIDQEQSL